jgi:hypothetical protein
MNFLNKKHVPVHATSSNFANTHSTSKGFNTAGQQQQLSAHKNDNQNVNEHSHQSQGSYINNRI